MMEEVKMLEIKGVIPPLTTPFKEDRTLDLEGFRKLTDMVIKDGVHGIVVNGCTGESWSLSGDEKALIFKAAVEQAVMIQPPWYVMITMDEVYEYFLEVIQATDLPVMIYNIPRRTGINLSVDLMDRLADEPKVVALKESSKDWLLLSAMIRKLRDRINVLAGYANLQGLAALSEGAVGYIDSSTPVLGKRSLEFYQAATSGNLEAARHMQANMAKLNAGFFGVGTFPAGIKVALDLLGRPGGWPRDPIKALNTKQKNAIREVLISVGLISADQVK
jgi:4-hydroxy-tetrahydrodipicolinate synthase